MTLPNSNGKTIKVGAFVEPLMVEEAEKVCDLVIKEVDFKDYKDKKLAKKLAQDYDYFISQATLMPKVAAAFGRVLGSRGKMPNPKLGCVIPPNANIKELIKKLAATVSLSAKKATNLQCMIGKENQPEEEIIANTIAVYKATLAGLPNESQNIKNICLKLTMGKPVKI
jgi:large subunit ribosomal protein L1